MRKTANVSGVRVGVLAGAAYSCTIDNVDVLESSVTGEQNCGGLLGFAMENSNLSINDCKIKNISLNTAATKLSDVQGAFFGGLVGFIHKDVNATITENRVSGITFTGLLDQDFYDSHSTVYYHYLSHPFIGSLMGITSNGDYNSRKTVLGNNTVEASEGLITGPTTNEYMGFYYRSDFATRPVTEIIIDGETLNNRPVAKIGDSVYATLAEAVAAAKDGETVTLLANCSGDGIVVAANKYPTGITIDFAGYSYTVGGKLVGSTGTASNGFQLLAGNTITMKNGFIYGDASVAGDDKTDWSGAPAMMIQNYSNLTLDNMTVSGGKQTVYTISNNNGNTVIKDSIINAGNADGTKYSPVAFDVCRFNSYPSVSVTVEGNSVINGNIEISGVIGEGQSRQLNIKDGTFNGKFSISGNVPANIAISGGTFTYEVNPDYCADGFIPTTNEDGTYGVKSGEYVAKVGNVGYESLAAAVEAAKTGDTVTLLADISLDKQIAISQGITIDGQGEYTIKDEKKLVSTDGKNKAGMFYRVTYAKGTLTFLNVTLDGNKVSKIFLNEGGAGETVFDDVTSINGGGISYGAGIHISGDGSHATIKNSTLTGSEGEMELNDTNYYAANDLWVGGNVYVTVEDSTIGTVFVNATGASTTSVHGNLTIKGAETKITYLSGEEYETDKNGNIGSLVTIENGEVETIFDKGIYNISGGVFKTEIKPEWCADGYVPTKNSDGTYGVTELKVTVSHQLIFGNDLTMRYYVTAEGFIVKYVEFSIFDAKLNGGKGGYTDPIKVYIDSNGAFSFDGINPQRMVDTIKAVAYFEKDGV